LVCGYKVKTTNIKLVVFMRLGLFVKCLSLLHSSGGFGGGAETPGAGFDAITS
jgi:hypothetical protein